MNSEEPLAGSHILLTTLSTTSFPTSFKAFVTPLLAQDGRPSVGNGVWNRVRELEVSMFELTQTIRWTREKTYYAGYNTLPIAISQLRRKRPSLDWEVRRWSRPSQIRPGFRKHAVKLSVRKRIWGRVIKWKIRTWITRDTVSWHARVAHFPFKDFLTLEKKRVLVINGTLERKGRTKRR